MRCVGSAYGRRCSAPGCVSVVWFRTTHCRTEIGAFVYTNIRSLPILSTFVHVVCPISAYCLEVSVLSILMG